MILTDRMICYQLLVMLGLAIAVILISSTGFAEPTAAAETEATEPEGRRASKFGGPNSAATTVEEDAFFDRTAGPRIQGTGQILHAG